MARQESRRSWPSCDNATLLDGTPWEYLKIRQKDCYDMQPADFEDLKMMR